MTYLLNIKQNNLIIKTAACMVLLDPKFRECFNSIFSSLQPEPDWMKSF